MVQLNGNESVRLFRVMSSSSLAPCLCLRFQGEVFGCVGFVMNSIWIDGIDEDVYGHLNTLNLEKNLVYCD